MSYMSSVGSWDLLEPTRSSVKRGTRVQNSPFFPSHTTLLEKHGRRMGLGSRVASRRARNHGSSRCRNGSVHHI
jgi:hypothetical protein